MRSRFDSAPLQLPLEPTEPRWRKWFQDVWSSLNAIGLPLPTAPAVGASPFSYQFLQAGSGTLIITGGTVTLVEWSRDSTTWYTVAAASPTQVALSQGDYVRITYTVAPTLVEVLR